MALPLFDFVTDRVAVGRLPRNAEEIERIRTTFTHALCVCRIPLDRVLSGVVVALAATDDDGRPKPASWFDEIARFARDALKQPDARLLVYCEEGRHRAPSAVYSILRDVLAMSPDASRHAIVTARPIARIWYPGPDTLDVPSAGWRFWVKGAVGSRAIDINAIGNIAQAEHIDFVAAARVWLAGRSFTQSPFVRSKGLVVAADRRPAWSNHSGIYFVRSLTELVNDKVFGMHLRLNGLAVAYVQAEPPTLPTKDPSEDAESVWRAASVKIVPPLLVRDEATGEESGVPYKVVQDAWPHALIDAAAALRMPAIKPPAANAARNVSEMARP